MERYRDMLGVDACLVTPKPAALSVTVETVASMWDDMQGLLVEHYEEIAQDKAAFALAPDRSTYDTLERAGKLLAIACRAEGVMVGYSVFIIYPHLHYRHTLIASNDVLFVTRDMRKSRAGLMLIRESEAQLKARGVVKAVWHVKAANDWSPILTHRGYQGFETSYGKLL